MRPIVVFFAFANDRVEHARYLRNLPEEQRRVRAAMAMAEKAGLCEIVERANATADEVLDVFQNPRYGRARLARWRAAAFRSSFRMEHEEDLVRCISGDVESVRKRPNEEMIT